MTICIRGRKLSTAAEVKQEILRGIYGPEVGSDLTEEEENIVCTMVLVMSRYATFLIDFVISEMAKDETRVRKLISARRQSSRGQDTLLPRPAMSESGWIGWTTVLTGESDAFEWNDQFADHHVGSFEDACRKCELHNALEVL
ncbi:MAG: hypothetical protein CMF22_11945 [Idiomarinaceae bacterium]|nr:hypothetical protein [Idiomarinaceae bacterium]